MYGSVKSGYICYMKKFLFLFTTNLAVLGLFGQEKWDLQRCVSYAIQNNISVKQADIQARLAGVQTQAAKWAQLPNASANTSLGTQWGRSIDPTTNLFTTTQLTFQGIGANVGIQVFNWGRLKYELSQAQINEKAAREDIKRVENDIALNVATFYLNVLASKQQIEIAQVQMNQTKTQLALTRQRVAAGNLPEVNAAEIEAQLARDSANVVTASTNYEQSVIQLKALLNIDMAMSFVPSTPPIDQIPVEPLAELDPAYLYKLALSNQPAQKVNELRLDAQKLGVKVAKSSFYPTITAFGGLATNFASPSKKVSGVIPTGTATTPAFVNVGGTPYFVQQPTFQVQQSRKNFGEIWEGWGRQLEQNFRQNVGFQLQIPIFNNGSAKLNLQRAKLQVEQAETNILQANLLLQQNIYQAYQNAINALQRYNSSIQSEKASEKVYEMAVKRYEAGFSNTLDLITNQNNLLRVKLEKLNNQFDYVFRLKLLEFYKGQGLKL